MPPMTSSRPGARLMRVGREKSNSAPSSARVRAINVGTGSRDRRWLGCGGTGRRSARGGRRRQRTLRRRWHRRTLGGIRTLRRLKDNLIVEAPAVAQLKLRRQHVRAGETDLIVGKRKTVRAARAVPAHPLIVERLQRADPRIAEALAFALRVEFLKGVKLEDDAARSFRRIAK